MRAEWGPFGAEGPVDAAAFAYPIADFYRTDPISRASETMAECSRVFAGSAISTGRTGTDG
jgi:NADH-quinone oxidoreductase subunit G